MKQASIQDIKQHLSSYVDRASGGERILIARHNRPVAILSPYSEENVTVGRHARRPMLGPAVARGSRGGILRTLANDRNSEP